MNRILNILLAHPAIFFSAAAIVWAVFISILNRYDKDWDPHDILVEANGMVFDLIVFGVILSLYDWARARRDTIARLHEEIDDYRGWEEPEAMYRIVGAIKRLNKLGVSVIDLSSCYLKGANLKNVNLKNSDLCYANLESAYLIRVNLSHTNLSGANLKFATLESVDLQMADLSHSELLGFGFHLDWKIKRKDREQINPLRSNITGVSFEGATVSKDWIYEYEENDLLGASEVKEKYEIDKDGLLKRRCSIEDIPF